MDLSDRIKALPANLRKIVKINGCTGFINGIHTKCCDLHDFDYSIGIKRKDADFELERCVWAVRKEAFEQSLARNRNIPCTFCRTIRRIGIFLKYEAWRLLAVLMFIAVRTFGWYFWEIGRWNRDGHPTGDKWWVIGRLKMWLRPK